MPFVFQATSQRRGQSQPLVGCFEQDRSAIGTALPLVELRHHRPLKKFWKQQTVCYVREKVLRPILAGVGKPKMGRKPKNWSSIDEHYEAVRQDMFTLVEDLRTAA